MKVCASSICWHRDSRRNMLHKASSAGFKFVEVLTMPPEIWDLHGNLRTLRPAELRDELNECGLTLAGLHLGAIKTKSEELRRSTTEYAKLALEFAQELGCGIIVDGGPDRANEPLEPFWRCLDELVPLFDKTPVKLALENHYRNSIQFIEDYDRIFARYDSPAVGMTLDTGHFTSAEVDPVEVARRFAPRVCHVHIKDHVGTRSVPLGQGRTDNFGVARALRERGYTGYLSQELEVADQANADRYAADGLDYMTRLCAVQS